MPLFKTRFKKAVNGAGSNDKTSVTQTSLNEDETIPAMNGEHVNGVVTSPVLGKSISMLSNGANSLRRDSKELERRQKEVELLVIVKDFTGTNKKEMTVHRGQVVQRMYSCGTWLNVQNVHGLTGYIPTDVSCPKEQVEDSMWCELNREESEDTGIYETVTDKPPPKPFPYNSISSNTSPSMSRHSSKSACPDTPQGAGPRRIPVRKLSGTPMAVIELSDSPPFSYYSTDPVLHPLHPLSITRSHVSSDSQTSCSFRESSQDSTVPSTPAVQPLLAHTRNDSYQEAVVDKDGGVTQVPKVAVRRPSRPSDLPMLPMCTAMGVKKMGQQRNYPILTSNGTTALHTLETSQASCLVDDVFLPSTQKPIGIYEVLKPYTKQAEGEVTVTRGEYVVAMQMGHGEWALVMTSSNNEGLVPRGHLCRYSNKEPRKKVSVGTQTELMIMAPVIHQHSTTSSSSSNTNRDIICIRDIGPDISYNNRKKKRDRDTHTALYRHSSPYYPLDSAWGDSRLRLSDDLWYENSMSIPQLPQNDSFFTNEAPSICTLPTFNGINHERGEAPLAFHSSRESLPQFPIKHFRSSLLNKRTVASENFSSPGSVRRTLREQSDWPMSPGVFSNFSEFSSSPRSPQMIVLKATKDFSPDVDGTDYLSLCKGDVLHLIPGNNPYKGWLWVHHIGQRCYGYVPKSHVSYPQHDLRHRNNNEGTTLYDEV